MVRLPVETATLSREAWDRAADGARASFRARHPERDPGDFVHFDEPALLSYRRFTAGASAQPIRITTAGGGARPLEADPRSIANNISTRLYFPRLFVPASIRDEVEAALGGVVLCCFVFACCCLF